MVLRLVEAIGEFLLILVDFKKRHFGSKNVVVGL